MHQVVINSPGKLTSLLGPRRCCHSSASASALRGSSTSTAPSKTTQSRRWHAHATAHHVRGWHTTHWCPTTGGGTSPWASGQSCRFGFPFYGRPFNCDRNNIFTTQDHQPQHAFLFPCRLCCFTFGLPPLQFNFTPFFTITQDHIHMFIKGHESTDQSTPVLQCDS
jgi:hypothetical protein